MPLYTTLIRCKTCINIVVFWQLGEDCTIPYHVMVVVTHLRSKGEKLLNMISKLWFKNKGWWPPLQMQYLSECAAFHHARIAFCKKKLISVLKCSKLATQITGRQMQAFRPGKSRVKIEIYQTANDWWRPSHSVHVVRCWLGIWQKSDY